MSERGKVGEEKEKKGRREEKMRERGKVGEEKEKKGRRREK